MNEQIDSEQNRQQKSRSDESTQEIADAASAAAQTLADIKGLIVAINEEKYETALELSQAIKHLPQVQNFVGVCLLRLGRIQQAVELYRELVLCPGTLTVRKELPLAYKTNLAAALLLFGHVSVCLLMLSQIGNAQDPTVLQLRAAIRQWERGLSFWDRLQWRWGAVEPTDGPVAIDFVPGQL